MMDCLEAHRFLNSNAVALLPELAGVSELAGVGGGQVTVCPEWNIIGRDIDPWRGERRSHPPVVDAVSHHGSEEQSQVEQ